MKEAVTWKSFAIVSTITINVFLSDFSCQTFLKEV